MLHYHINNLTKTNLKLRFKIVKKKIVLKLTIK